MTDNQHDIIQQLHSHCADYTLKAEKGRNIVHLAAMHGDKMAMDTLSQARPIGVDAESKDSRGKTTRECFQQRCEESAPDGVKGAFITLHNTLLANEGSH